MNRRKPRPMPYWFVNKRYAASGLVLDGYGVRRARNKTSFYSKFDKLRMMQLSHVVSVGLNRFRPRIRWGMEFDGFSKSHIVRRHQRGGWK